MRKTIIYNDTLIEEESLLMPFLKEDLWRYGLLAFETMHCYKNKVLFLSDHLERLKMGMSLLSIPKIERINENWIYKKLEQLSETSERMMVRLSVRSNGAYDDFDYLLTFKDFEFKNEKIAKAIIAQNTRIAANVLATCKTGNRIPYFLAEQEMKEKKATAAILLNKGGFVADSNISNVFWVKNDFVFTTPLNDGGISGVMRKNLLKHFSANDVNVRTTSIQEEELKSMDGVFLTNVIQGCKPIKKLDHTRFDLKKTESIIQKANELFY